MLIRSYKSPFILLFVLLLVATVSSVAYNAYRRAAKVSLDLSGHTIAEISDKIVQRTVDIFERARAGLEVDALVVGESDIISRQDDLLELFWKQLHLTPQLLSLYVADVSGSFLQARDQPQLVTRVIDRRDTPAREQLVYRDKAYRPLAHINGGALFDPRETPWYRGTEPDGRVHWSPVYHISAVEKLGLTASKAVRGSTGQVQAIVGVDIALEGLSEFLAEQRFAQGGVALIVDGQDRLVAFPYQLRLKPHSDGKPFEGAPRVTDLADPWLVDAYAAITLNAALQAAQTAGRDYSISEPGGRALSPVSPASRPPSRTGGYSSWYQRRLSSAPPSACSVSPSSSPSSSWRWPFSSSTTSPSASLSRCAAWPITPSSSGPSASTRCVPSSRAFGRSRRRTTRSSV